MNQVTVINQLDLTSLIPGTHHFLVAIGDDALGQTQQLPVKVIKSATPAKTVLVTAGIHGDELNGVMAAHQLGRELDGTLTSGTLIIMPTININGMLRHTRDYIPTDPDASPTNLNRIFPGKSDGNNAERFAHHLWQFIQGINADACIDLHTQTKGAAYPLYVFADFRIAKALEYARTLQPDMLFNDPGDPGIFETEMNNAGIPTITVEVGAGKRFQAELVERTFDGIKAILAAENMLSLPSTLKPINTIEGNSIVSIRAKVGGLAVPSIALGEEVIKGQVVAKQYDLFGELIQSYTTPVAGHVCSINEDPMREAGSLLVRVLY